MSTHETVRIENVTKRFGSTIAVNDVSLEIPGGSFTTLLGPSGCGKTTLLRIIAGLERADSGRVTVGNTVLFDSERGISVPVRRRGIGLVFQSYALWPHMTVHENVAYGLKLKNLPAEQIETRIQAILNTVGMSGYEKRYPSELSGGQQQRVSMARMLVIEPAVLLMDEPLSNLDAKLRLNLRAELKRIHETIGMTVVYVTHDQTEAMTLSSHVAVMNEGVVQQWDAPRRVYRESANLFVAEFMGTPATNRLRGRIRLRDSSAVVSAVEGSVTVPLTNVWPETAPALVQQLLHDDEQVELCIRPEEMTLSQTPIEGYAQFKVYAALDSGPDVHIYLEGTDGTRIIVRDDTHLAVHADESLYVGFPPGAIKLYRVDTGALITPTVAPATPAAP